MTRGVLAVNAQAADQPLLRHTGAWFRTFCGRFSTKKQDFHGETTVKLTYLGQNRLNFLTFLQISSQVFFLLLTSGHRIRGRIPWVPGST
jgi:hypothetical protein